MKTRTIDGVTFTNIHSGQQRAYGDSHYEYEVSSDRPSEHVKRVCCEQVDPCNLSVEQWREGKRESGGSMDSHFRAHYVFQDLGGGKYRYCVTFPYTG